LTPALPAVKGSAKFSWNDEDHTVTRTELGTKRVCPETDKKFYDLDKDPVVSPYTGKEYPRSFFEQGPAKPEKPKPAPSAEVKKAPEPEPEEETTEEADGPEIVSLEDAEEDSDDDGDEDDEEAIATIPDVEIEVEDDESEGDTFLEEDEEDDDLSDVIGDGAEGDEET